MSTPPKKPVTASQWLRFIDQGHLDQVLLNLYGQADLSEQRKRYCQVIETHQHHYPDQAEIRLFSTPGRTEIGGNHTDHNHGRVLAASVHLDAIAAVSPLGAEDSSCSVFSMNFDREYLVSLEDLTVRHEEAGSTASLIRGTAAWFLSQGLSIGGFNATLESRVLPGSGLSSSACIEVLLATIMDRLYNRGSLGAVGRALCGKFAENQYFGKPSGLMDQLACSLGGLAQLDFQDPQSPQIQEIQVDFNALGYQLCIVDTRSDHSAGTQEYAAIPREMQMTARALGKQLLGEVEPREFWSQFGRLKAALPGRAMSRAGHFFTENARVPGMLQSLVQETPDIQAFLSLVRESGQSSFKYLQNVVDQAENQDYALALLLAEQIPSKRGIVSRVHGGGFGGTIQAYVPLEDWQNFVETMEAQLGQGTVVPLRIRNAPSLEVSELSF